MQNLDGIGRQLLAGIGALLCSLALWSTAHASAAPDTSSLQPNASADDVLPGDVNRSGYVDLSDVIALLQYLFKGGPAPDPLCTGDVNGDGSLSVGDAIYLINYLFRGGPEPIDGCGSH
jgi:hypothetical protein